MTQKELGYVELEWTCKHCGTINPGMNRICSNCGAPIAQDDKFELPDQQVMITDQQKIDEAKAGPAIQCPYCDVLNPAGTKICIQCGGDIQAGLARQAGEVLGAYKTDAAPDRPCPSCGQPVKANAQRCPHCGGSLVEDAKPIAAPPVPKKPSRWLLIGGIALGLLCIASVVLMLVLGNQTSDVTASVSEVQWERSIDILARQPVQKSVWSEDVPSEAENVSCRDEYKETRNEPIPDATEVCGTPYTVDTGSGAGKVVQDCEYLVYASYCDFTVLDWVVVSTALAQGNDLNPQWPLVSLQSGQQEGERNEKYQVSFATDGETYAYTPADLAEFSQFDPGSQWLLSINTFGQIKELSSK